MYVDQLKNKCAQYNLCAKSPEELKGHVEDSHKERLTSNHVDIDLGEERNVFCCMQCRFKSGEQVNHIKQKHDSILCEE